MNIRKLQHAWHLSFSKIFEQLKSYRTQSDTKIVMSMVTSYQVRHVSIKNLAKKAKMARKNPAKKT